ncbi:MAG TPA: rhomboid family intramembrane serine protease [Gallionellaceae bacterium]|nr:rhomboid family intramembrane serine protease [Gallionellaceae bacterium]
MMGYTPAGVRFLLIVTVMSFMVEMYAGENAIASLALWPLQAEFKPWQLFTYAFLHASTAHLAINMYGLWMFGSEMEHLLGRRTFFWLYFASIFTAGLTQLLVMSSSGAVTPTVGASGGVFGLLLAYGMCFPKRIVMLLIPPIPLPARLFVFLYAGLELLLGVTGAQANVAHFAHLGGMIGGYLVIRRWRKRMRWH